MSSLALLTLISDMFVRSTPLILTGLAVAVAFQAGILNIGAEGQFLIGAAMSTAVSLRLGPELGSGVTLIALLAGSIAGAFWAAIAAELRSRFHVLEVISTIMLLHRSVLHFISRSWAIAGAHAHLPANIFDHFFSATPPDSPDYATTCRVSRCGICGCCGVVVAEEYGCRIQVEADWR